MDRYSNHTPAQLREIRENKENAGIYCDTVHTCLIIDKDSKGRVTHMDKFARFGEVIDQDETVNVYVSPAKGGWAVAIHDHFNGSDVPTRIFARKYEAFDYGTFVAKNILHRYKWL